MTELSTDDLITGWLVAEEGALSANASPKKLAERIEKRSELTLLGLVKMLGPTLVAEAPEKRGRGVGLLAATLTQLPATAVNRQEARHLVDYLTNPSCLGASETLVQSADGLSALAKLPVFGQGDTTQVCRAIFKHIDMRTHHQAVRFVVYSLVDVLMSIRREALKNMGPEFLKGYCQLAEGEKDPRNLKLAFSLDRIILLEFDISECVEDLFDITFCYFPITFTPPPDDPYGISSEELQRDLRICLASTPLFGPLALPLVLDKLQASTKSAKTQSLEAIVTCFPVYGKAAVDEYAKVFWEALNLEVFNATDQAMETLALRAMRSFLATLYPTAAQPEAGEDVDMTDTNIPEIKGPVATALKDDVLYEITKTPDKTSAQVATKILAAGIAGSAPLYSYVISLAIPTYLKMMQEGDHASVRPDILNHIGGLLEATLHAPSTTARPLEPLKDELVSILASASQAPTTATPALQTLATLCRVDGLLTAEDRLFIISCFNDQLKPDSDPAVTTAALSHLTAVTGRLSREICDRTLPQLYAQLPDAPPSDTAYISALNALAQLCTPSELYESLVIRVLGRLEQTTPQADPASALYSHHLLTTLKVVTQKKASRQDLDLSRARTKLVPKLFSLFIRPDSEAGCWKDDRLVLDSSETLSLLVKTMSAQEQASLMTAVDAAYRKNELSGLIGVQPAAKLDVPFSPFESSASRSQANSVILYSAVLGSVPKEAIAEEAVSFVCERCWQGIKSGSLEGLTQRAAFQILAVSANKKVEALSGFLDEVGRDSASSSQSIQAMAWVSRGLVTRSDQRGFAFAEKLLSLCKDTNFGFVAARAVGLVAEDKDGLLTKENHAVVRLLYRQRLCSTLLKLIVEQATGDKETPSESNRLVALSVLLRNMPKQMILTEVPKCMALLLRALEIPDAELCVYVVDTLALMTAEATDSITPHSSSLIITFTKISSTSPSPRLRLAALEALKVFPEKIPYLALQAHKVTVLRALGKVVGDRKKSVRKGAVDCRETWYGLQAS